MWPHWKVNLQEASENSIPGLMSSLATTLSDQAIFMEDIHNISPPSVVRVAAVLTANQEVTPSNDPQARGTSVLQLNQAGNALSYKLTVFGLDFGHFIGDGTPFTSDIGDDVTKVHIHSAIRGENGPLAFAPIDLSDSLIDNQDADDLRIVQNTDGSVTLMGRWEVSDPALISLSEFVEDLQTVEAGGEIPLYWNVHTQGSPSGAIRGQFLERGLQPPVKLSANLTTSQEVSPSNNPNASGTSTLALNEAGDALRYTLTVFGLDFGQFIGDGTPFTSDTSDDVTKVHVHNGIRGENGPLAFAPIDLSDLSVNDQDRDDLQITQNKDGSVTLRGIWETSDPAVIPLSDFVNDIREREVGQDVPLYWNIHTQGSPDGAIRGQWQVDSLTRDHFPHCWTTAPQQRHLLKSHGYDRLIAEAHLASENIGEHFHSSDYGAIGAVDLSSATNLSVDVLKNDGLMVSFSSCDVVDLLEI
ncbi:CHRD domain-containing protein [Acaryochloris sp. IP29b_bin.137]|uniref:CHRD domain-containing protein n=1 Tax=Acaryochloris sp. IP29b_bin.137 TaxID=2969217 RepID=UPI0026395271|nr:CHRD domain-containing protein [Acaryochloris sp. IP29b_bin.137]